MRIKYDMTKNYFKYYNESPGVIANKDEIIKNPKIKVYNYIERGIINVMLILLAIIFSIINTYIIGENILSKILIAISLILLIIMLLYFLVFYISYSVENKRKHIGSLEVDAEGIKDYSDDGMIVGFSWNNIKAVVIKKHTINILTDNTIYFFIDIKYKERLLLAIDRYNKDLLIIDKTK